MSDALKDIESKQTCACEAAMQFFNKGGIFSAKQPTLARNFSRRSKYTQSVILSWSKREGWSLAQTLTPSYAIQGRNRAFKQLMWCSVQNGC